MFHSNNSDKKLFHLEFKENSLLKVLIFLVVQFFYIKTKIMLIFNQRYVVDQLLKLMKQVTLEINHK
jgi:hypothetical protein